MTTPDQSRQERLKEKFPRLMTHETPYYMLTYGQGWDGLIGDLMRRIDGLLNDAQAASFRVFQIKEKFGTLRFYYSLSGASDLHLDLFTPAGVVHTVSEAPQVEDFPRAQIAEAVREAERRSSVTCEECGAPGILREARWSRVRCDLCEIVNRELHGSDE